MSVDEPISAALDAADALAAKHRYREAFDALARLNRGLAQVQRDRIHPQLYARLRRGLWRYAPQWWKPIEHGSYRLRRCDVADADFYRSCYADTHFTTRFNRQRPWKGDLHKALEKYGRESPVDLGALLWIVCRTDDQPLGLATLSSIDSQNRRAELSLGFPGAPPLKAGLIASLLAIQFAFFTVRLHKLQCTVYEDNPKAIRNVERIGFRREGVLIDQYHVPGKGYMDIHLFGLTMTQLRDSPIPSELAKRFLGQDWASR